MTSWLASHVVITNVCVMLHGMPAAPDAVAADVAPVTAFQCVVDGEPDPDMTILVVACSVLMSSWTFGQVDRGRGQCRFACHRRLRTRGAIS